jgi:hypothetical protein
MCRWRKKKNNVDGEVDHVLGGTRGDVALQVPQNQGGNEVKRSSVGASFLS